MHWSASDRFVSADVAQLLREAGGLTQKQTWYRLAAGSLINGGKGGIDIFGIASREEALLSLCGGGWNDHMFLADFSHL